MIEKVKGGYQVKSESKGKDGKRKNLSKPESLGEAKKRLQQVHYFKNRGK